MRLLSSGITVLVGPEASRSPPGRFTISGTGSDVGVGSVGKGTAPSDREPFPIISVESPVVPSRLVAVSTGTKSVTVGTACAKLAKRDLFIFIPENSLLLLALLVFGTVER